ncbi:MAG TPA: hypothetical protein VKZ70_12075 [Burkholderiaceae bacterium]|nr:hypothetical protein [Burkholderiaceae bacterium]
MKEPRKPPGNDRSDTDIVRKSFERETNVKEHAEARDAVDEEGRRSLMGAPVDPNSPTTQGRFPPGLPEHDAVDPGRATPGAAPVDNRSGARDRRKSKP